MIECHYWECEFCGEKFEDEDSAEKHEWLLHRYQAVRNDLVLLDWNRKQIVLTEDNIMFPDNAFYVKWNTTKAFHFWFDWFEAYLGHTPEIFVQIKGDEVSDGFIFYDEDKMDWEDFSELEMEYQELAKIKYDSPP